MLSQLSYAPDTSRLLTGEGYYSISPSFLSSGFSKQAAGDRAGVPLRYGTAVLHSFVSFKRASLYFLQETARHLAFFAKEVYNVRQARAHSLQAGGGLAAGVPTVPAIHFPFLKEETV